MKPCISKNNHQLIPHETKEFLESPTAYSLVAGISKFFDHSQIIDLQIASLFHWDACYPFSKEQVM